MADDLRGTSTGPDVRRLLRDFYAEDETDRLALERAQQQREAQNDSARQLNAISTNFFGGRDRGVPAASDPVKDLEAQRALRDSQRAARTQSREQSEGAASLASYLQRQGLSAEDAEVMARNPRLMQTWDAGRQRQGDRDFRSNESAADRAFRAQEGARSRATQRELAQMRGTAAGERAETKAAGEDLKNTDRLRGEFERAPEVKAYRDSSISMEKMEHAAGDPSAAGDLALIFSYMKVLDPGSTVREGEFATAQNAAGVDGRVQSAYNKLLSGERLNPGQRSDFLRRARGLHQTHRKAYDEAASQYSRLARERGANPRNVVRDAPDRGPSTPGSFDLGGGVPSMLAAPGGTVRMRSPDDGAVYEIDSAEADEAAANGWEAL